jgi:hypothetical protein
MTQSMPIEAHAVLDESIREGVPGFYVLAATVVGDDQAVGLREALRGLVPRPSARFHWHEERQAKRLAMCDLLVAHNVRHVVAVASPLDPQRQERARRLCLTAIAWELHERGVHRLQLESRNNRDADDRRFLLGEQRVDRVPAALQYEFGRPRQEPLLWAPDAVAGAVATAVGTGDLTYLRTLGETVYVHRLPGPPP